VSDLLRRPGTFVDGELRSSSGRTCITVVDPTSEEPFGEASRGTAADVDRAARSAARSVADRVWSDRPLEERIAVVRRIGQLLDGHREELATLAAREMGWPRSSGRLLGDAMALIDAYVDAVEQVRFAYRREGVGRGDAVVVRRPLGVVAGITPWNAPLRSVVKKVIPALLAGCSVVIKPAPETPFDALRLAELAIEAGVPPGVLNVVPGDASTGEALVVHADVRKVAFTGSTAAGRHIAAAAGAQLKRLQLELGGKSAALVLDDADPELVARTLADQVFRGAGQTCTALTRAIVPRSRHDELVEALIEAAGRHVVGDPLDDATTIGPLASARQRERVLAYLRSARDDGAVAVVGGGIPADRPKGFFVEPTVLTGVRPDMRVAREEIFGPVLCVLTYDGEAEALDLVNDSDYGLHGAVFSADEDRALQLARQFDTGSVSVNALPIPVTAPFGGVKASGLGREHGVEGYDHFLEYQSLIADPAIVRASGMLDTVCQ
jgi:betaine-aldehyde dehydrogenase